jgi:hypothetical protein
MIKWKSSKGGKTLLGFGLEAGNVEKLMNGQPIYIYGKDIGEPVDILIHYGSTKEQMIEDMKEAGAVLPPEDQWQTSPTEEQK